MMAIRPRTGTVRAAQARRGYLRTAEYLNRSFNFVLALFLVVAASPLLVVIYFMVIATSGRPGIYRGTRLGRNRKPFTMYKFRTLVRDAETRVHAELLSEKHRLYTPIGRFLRDTRLDELPQLVNILQGDMDFVGPRPERPAIYERFCKHIPGYDRRFAVRPALIGLSQLFTPHGSPKEIRAKIDNRLLGRKQVLLWDAYIIFLAGLVVLRTTCLRLLLAARNVLWRRLVRRMYSEKRDLVRVPLGGARVLLDGSGHELPLVDINDMALLVHSETPLEAKGPQEARLEVLLGGNRGIGRRKRVRCTLEFYRESRRPDGCCDTVFLYQPASPFNYYLVHQYFLRESVVDLRRLRHPNGG